MAHWRPSTKDTKHPAMNDRSEFDEGSLGLRKAEGRGWVMPNSLIAG